jgi:4-diphosphocytidyl-2-C-methyl-D-erythritol kinase
MRGAVLREEAHAKINLGLKVLGRRPDGYHEMRSIVQSLDLADALYFRPAAENGLTCSEERLSCGPDNLVRQALELFNARLRQKPRPFHIHLEKNVPWGAGLGGGSADAAATLRGLNRLHGAPFSPSELRLMGSCLGADVPFLIEGGTALMSGRGDELQPLRWEGEVFYVLVYPGVEVSTAWAYAQIRPSLTDENPYLSFIASLSGGRVDCEALFEVLENDFQPVVERAYPIVAQLRSHLDRSGARTCSISGSGSTVYGIFDDRNAAYQVQQELQARGHRSFLCGPA